jgi:hypothetical protein
MQIIPLQDTPTQNFTINLGSQQTQISIYTRTTGLYCDVSVNNTLIIGGVLCLNLVKIVQNTYLGFIGDLIWYDTQGDIAPSSPGLGTRYILYYLSTTDLNGAG